jgi:N-acetylglutamate synthase-like GNAT family acetyltransferase
MEYRELKKEELPRLREVDRTEVVDKIYYQEEGRIVLKDEHYEIPYDWWVKHVENDILPRLNSISDKGGIFFGAFENDKMVGLAGLENEFIGLEKDQLNMVILHVSNPYRKKGVASHLMEMVKDRAKEMGARRLYISATPSENTVNFYLNRGCKVTKEVDKRLLELEPDDIHMELEL